MTILQEILEYKKQEVLKQKQQARSFYKVLQAGKFALIAEVKKASPSKGIIREDFNHIEIAQAYAKAGAAAISVLTDEKFFKGNVQYLKDIRAITDLPILRKDFIIDEFQVYETKIIGADIILLIVAALDKAQIKDYYDLSRELGLEVLVEVHDRKEFDTAVELGANIIGINNRDLKTFEVNLQNTVNIIKEGIPEGVFVISESGIQDNGDVKFLKENGVSGILVGEALMREKNIETAVLNLLK
ncbi:MAG: hypothetical protein A2Y25_02985 [Candidatus Melainabacteria bacterium GWF2_37_15]|nr:MAG: hypothetical protein A2Y25_02985 [Candidatus Melainabacteria bacterium GWF2_37_15]